jgi:recombination protein RecA
VQKNGGIAGLVDAERAFDGFSMGWAQSRGVNTEELALAKPDTAEEGLTTMLEWAKSGAVDVAIYDSVASLAPKSEGERDLEQDTMALIARLNSQFFRMFTAHNANANMCAVFLNQVRTDLGSYGSPVTTPGGKAIHFYASLELGLRRGPKKDWPENGYTLVAKVNKTKVSGCKPENTEATVNFTYANGIDNNEAIIVLAMDSGIIARKSETSPIYLIPKGEEILEVKGKGNVLEAVKADDLAFGTVAKKVGELVK